MMNIKKYLLVLLIGFSQYIFSQNSAENSDEKTYSVAEVDIKAEFPGRMPNFYSYIAKNFVKPGKSTPGKVFLSFIIETDGSLSNVKIIKNTAGTEFGLEAIRVLGLSPKWTPAEKDGKKVRALYAIPIAS